MTPTHDPDRLIRAFLETGPTELPDRSFDAVRDQIEQTHQRTVIGPWRRSAMSRFARNALTAAAVLVAAFVIGVNVLPGLGGSSGGPVASASPTPTPSPTAVPSGEASTLTVGDPFPVEIAFEVGPGWVLWGDLGAAGKGWYKGSADPPDGIGMTFWNVTNIPNIPCGGVPLDPPLGPSVDDLANALVAQPHTVVTKDVAVTVDGYSGRYLEYTADDLSGCSLGIIVRWMTMGPIREALPGEHDRVWILDVDGSRIVIDAFSFEGTTAESHAELEAIVATIRIGPD